MKANGWPVKPLGDLCAIRPPKAEARIRLRADSEVSFLPMEDLGIDVKHPLPVQRKRLDEVEGSYTYFADGDVLLAKITPCFQNGKLGIAKELTNGVGFGSSEFIVLRPRPELDREYLYYFLSRDEFRQDGALRMGGAVGQQRVPPEYVLGERLPLPPLPEQRRIVGILDDALAAIATAKANAEKNLENAVCSTEALLDDFLKPHEGWTDNHKPLAEMCVLIVDCEHKTAPTQEEGIPSIRTPNIGKGTLLLDGVYRVSEKTYKAWTRRAEPQAGDLILAREAPAGNVAVIPKGLRVCLGQRTVLIRPKRDVFEPDFLAGLLLRSDLQRRLLAHSRGATVEHVNMADIRALRIGAIPALHEQREILAKIRALREASGTFSRIYADKLRGLDDLKKSLLHHAFSGQLGRRSACPSDRMEGSSPSEVADEHD